MLPIAQGPLLPDRRGKSTPGEPPVCIHGPHVVDMPITVREREENMTIRPQEIAFDFDGVVADTFRHFVRLARDQYHYDISYEDITDYLFLNSVAMDKRHALEIIDILTNDLPELDILPNKGAGEVLTRLTESAPLLVVTARAEAEPVELWFARQIPALPSSCLHIEATGASTAKLEVLMGHNIKYFIDDRLDTCEMLFDAGITPIVYNQPWNRRAHPFLTVSTWDDIESLMGI